MPDKEKLVNLFSLVVITICLIASLSLTIRIFEKPNSGKITITTNYPNYEYSLNNKKLSFQEGNYYFSSTNTLKAGKYRLKVMDGSKKIVYSKDITVYRSESGEVNIEDSDLFPNGEEKE